MAVQKSDLPEIRSLIEATIRHCVATSQEETDFLVADIASSLEWWRDDGKEAIHLKYVDDDRIVGVILLKQHWNLVNLFVLPGHQRRGIGRSLFRAVEPDCRRLSPRARIQVNSSTNAVAFYKAIGFQQTGPGVDRPGGCIPLEYRF